MTEDEKLGRLCKNCGHPRNSHKWAHTNAYGTVYRFRRCRRCQAERRRRLRPGCEVCGKFE